MNRPTIVRYREVADIPGRRAALEAQLDAIFFESSGTTTFASEAARNAFRHRWLGRFLLVCPNDAFLAIDSGAVSSGASDRVDACEQATVAGYLVGSLADPAFDEANAELGFVAAFAPLSRRYPAHLHINLAPRYRSGGTGARLIEAFADHAQTQGAPGLHVVTARGMRNVGFYLRNGFAQLGDVDWNGRQLVFLGRDLERAARPA